MASKYKEFYETERQPIGYYTMTNFGGLAVFDVRDIDSETYAIVGDYDDKPDNIRRHKLYTTFRGRAYFIRYGQRYYLDDFMRVDFYGGGIEQCIKTLR